MGLLANNLSRDYTHEQACTVRDGQMTMLTRQMFQNDSAGTLSFVC